MTTRASALAMRMLVGQTPTVSFGLGRLFAEDNVGDLTLTTGAYESNAWYCGDSIRKPFLTAWGTP